jgi:hypothetical protein
MLDVGRDANDEMGEIKKDKEDIVACTLEG